eukprot:986915-Prymnesium_polylepis.1
MERRRVHKMPTVSSFSRQPQAQRVVRARRREKRPFRLCDLMPQRSKAERPRLTVSLLDRSVNPSVISLRI